LRIWRVSQFKFQPTIRFTIRFGTMMTFLIALPSMNGFTSAEFFAAVSKSASWHAKNNHPTLKRFWLAGKKADLVAADVSPL